MGENIIRIVSDRLSEAVEAIDDEVNRAVLDLWSEPGPGPDCPTLYRTAARINAKCRWGLLEREKEARAALARTINEIGMPVTEEIAEAIERAVESHFPRDKYISYLQNTKDVYQRAQAPINKMSARPFDLELSKAKAASANLGRRSVNRIKTDLDAMKARDALVLVADIPEAAKEYSPSTFSRAARWVGSHLMGIIITVIGGLGVAVVSTYFGLG